MKKWCLLLAIGLFVAATPAAATDRMNFLVILVDDMGWADAEYNGGDLAETPNIDKLAARGMNFPNGYAASPLCSPTRGSIATGKSPARLHLNRAANDNRKPMRAEEIRFEREHLRLVAPGSLGHLPLEEVTIAEMLKPIGYRTAFFGKWHLTAPKYGDRFHPEHQGFDLNVGGGAYAGPPSYFSPYKIKENLPDGPDGEYLTDRLTSEVEKYLEAHTDEPFLLYLWHYGVHAPWQGKQEITDAYIEKLTPEHRHRNPVYASMIQSVDESVGRIIKKLEDTGLDKSTVVFFTSDNGGLLQRRGGKSGKTSGQHITTNHPLRGGKAMIYEGGIREPFVVYWPGVTRDGATSQEVVLSTDIVPTILEIAAAQAPEDEEIDGTSLVPALKGASLEREFVCWHFPTYKKGYRPYKDRETFWNIPSSAIRQDDWKLIVNYEGPIELYNLKEDIGERRDLAKIHPKLVKELREKLDAWLAENDAWLPIPNPRFNPDLPLSKNQQLLTDEVPSHAPMQTQSDRQ